MKSINKMESLQVQVRRIKPKDNAAMAQILRETLKEHGAAKPGTAYYDQSTDSLSAYFQRADCAYFVAETGEKVVGGVGIYPTEGLPEGTCELVKMYIDQHFRGLGIGKTLIDKAIEFAKEQGYNRIYLESMPELQKAVAVYEHLGFKHLTKPLGNTGHFSCPIWMLKEI